MIIRAFILLLGLFFTAMVNANDIKHSVGIGLPYSGLVGYQIAMVEGEKHQYRASLGFIGASVGYDYLLDKNWTLGATYTSTLRTVYSVNATYYFKSVYQGFSLGLDLGYMPDEDDGEGFFATQGSKSVMWLNVGYKF